MSVAITIVITISYCNNYILGIVLNTNYLVFVFEFEPKTLCLANGNGNSTNSNSVIVINYIANNTT